MKYEWTREDAKAVGMFMGELEGTVKIIACMMVILAGCAIVAVGYLVLS